MQMRVSLIVYWVTTAFIAAEMAAGGITDLIRGGTAIVAGQPVVEIIQALGYPDYLLTILGLWKVPCAIVLLWPALPRLKEWAYAGAVFNYSGALASYVLYMHVVDVGTVTGLGLLLLITLASWALRPAGRRLGTLFPARETGSVSRRVVTPHRA